VSLGPLLANTRVVSKHSCPTTRWRAWVSWASAKATPAVWLAGLRTWTWSPSFRTVSWASTAWAGNGYGHNVVTLKCVRFRPPPSAGTLPLIHTCLAQVSSLCWRPDEKVVAVGYAGECRKRLLSVHWQHSPWQAAPCTCCAFWLALQGRTLAHQLRTALPGALPLVFPRRGRFQAAFSLRLPPLL